MNEDEYLSRTDPAVGLCQVCRHVRTVRNERGSVFYLCQRSATDPRFEKYPRLPVLQCIGFEPARVPKAQESKSG